MKEQIRRHKKRKREWEMSLITGALKEHLLSTDRSEILEFGSGMGFQLPFLRRLGQVRASDIYDGLLPENAQGIDFSRCGIDNTPFKDEEFDLIFSNHVIEHVEKLNEAFVELKRIGKSDCLYAFSVPTNWWLLLSIPAQYANKVRAIIRKLIPVKRSAGQPVVCEPGLGLVARGKWEKIRYFMFPNGHGNFSNFLSAYRAFKIKSWRDLFTKADFEILAVKPLLLYAPSEFPVVPTSRFLVNRGLCSSTLFVLKKHV